MHQSPHNNRMPARTRRIVAHHLILTLYGHWPPNDPRGSNSFDFYDQKFKPLGEIHHGRKPPELQPSREELRDFQTRASVLMNFPVFWMDDAKRQATADAFAEVITSCNYTCYACAILTNHAHLCIRIHRDHHDTMLANLAEASAQRLRLRLTPGPNLTRPDQHPIWNGCPWAGFRYTPDEVRRTVHYIEGNPEKERLPRQHWPFAQPYNNWPHHKH
jgi:REP element-mobilizing transposase RayT